MLLQDLIRLVGLTQMIRDQRMQGRQPDDTLRQPTPSQHHAGLVDQLDIMMGLRPVIPYEQQPSAPLWHGSMSRCGEI